MLEVLQWLKEWGGWITGLSALMLLGSVWLVWWLIVRMPSDYFQRRNGNPLRDRSLTSLVLFIVRNAMGVVLIVAGCAMLLLPGQGILTLLFGLSLTNFPYRRTLLQWLLRKQSLRRSINWIRLRADKPPLIVDTLSGDQWTESDQKRRASSGSHR